MVKEFHLEHNSKFLTVIAPMKNPLMLLENYSRKKQAEAAKRTKGDDCNKTQIITDP